MITRLRKKAFSLIELAIVLIIIGLLIAGVLGGAALVKNAELQSVMSEARGQAVVVSAFNSRFDAYPGDFGNATFDNVDYDGTNIADATGDGNNRTESNNQESWKALVQLRVSNVYDPKLEGSDINTAVGAATAPQLGTNIPTAKLGSSGWILDYVNDHNVIALVGSFSSAISTGTSNTVVGTIPVGGGTPTTPKSTGVIEPRDALSIDRKLDDGNPVTGLLRAYESTDTGCLNTDEYSNSNDKVCVLTYNVDVQR